MMTLQKFTICLIPLGKYGLSDGMLLTHKWKEMGGGGNVGFACAMVFESKLYLNKSLVCKFTNRQLWLLQLSKSIFFPSNFMVKSITVVFRLSL